MGVDKSLGTRAFFNVSFYTAHLLARTFGTAELKLYATTVLVPDLSFDSYLTLRQVGSRGFGEIWTCRPESLGDLRALNFIPSSRAGCLDKEFHALGLYRNAASRRRPQSLLPLEHANLLPVGLFYV